LSGPFGKTLIVLSDPQHRGFSLQVIYLVRDGASFFGALVPVFGVVDGERAGFAHAAFLYGPDAFASGASGHQCFLAVKPNEPKDDGDRGAQYAGLPISRCEHAPLIRSYEREANGTTVGQTR